MAPVEPVGVGLVGYGLAGRSFHAPFVDAIDGLRLRAIVTSDPERRARADRRAPGGGRPRRASTRCSSGADIDVVVVATPNRFHVPIASQALSSGRHVVVDKPMAMDVGEAEQLIDAGDARPIGCCPSTRTGAGTATS